MQYIILWYINVKLLKHAQLSLQQVSQKLGGNFPQMKW